MSCSLQCILLFLTMALPSLIQRGAKLRLVEGIARHDDGDKAYEFLNLRIGQDLSLRILSCRVKMNSHTFDRPAITETYKAQC
jgi:hypothetical protein